MSGSEPVAGRGTAPIEGRGRPAGEGPPPIDGRGLPAGEVRAADGEIPTPARALIDNRRYAWIVGGLAAVLVVGFLVYALTSHHAGSGTPGVPAGQPLRYFAAPLAASTLNGDANLDPPCTLARHDPRALNVCLLAKRGPLVLDFFVTGLAGVRARGEHDAGACVGTRDPGRGVRGGGGQRRPRRHREGGPRAPLDDPRRVRPPTAGSAACTASPPVRCSSSPIVAGPWPSD